MNMSMKITYMPDMVEKDKTTIREGLKPSFTSTQSSLYDLTQFDSLIDNLDPLTVQLLIEAEADYLEI